MAIDQLRWFAVKDGNLVALDLFSRHYSKYHYADGRQSKLIAGPGEKMVLLTADGRALFVWRKFIDRSGQKGINCAIFRNEGNYLSSELILEAEQLAWLRWPGERLYTYVNDKKIKSNNPGYCFLMANWRRLEYRTKRRQLVVLEKVPNE